jgi:hypothetical protein
MSRDTISSDVKHHLDKIQDKWNCTIALSNSTFKHSTELGVLYVDYISVTSMRSGQVERLLHAKYNEFNIVLEHNDLMRIDEIFATAENVCFPDDGIIVAGDGLLVFQIKFSKKIVTIACRKPSKNEKMLSLRCKMLKRKLDQVEKQLSEQKREEVANE